jgi:hypothetical protein
MAAGSTGAVGMFALMRQTSTNTSRAPGATIAGSNLRYVNLNGNDGGSTVTPAGTWRIHGSNTSGSGDAANSSVWQRIS